MRQPIIQDLGTVVTLLLATLDGTRTSERDAHKIIELMPRSSFHFASHSLGKGNSTPATTHWEARKWCRGRVRQPAKRPMVGRKADSTLRSSQAVPHPSTNRALRRLTSEVRRDPVCSTRYGRQRRHMQLVCPPLRPGAGAHGRGPQAAAATRAMRAPHSVWLARAGARGAPRADADQACLHHNHEATAGAHSGGGGKGGGRRRATGTKLTAP